MEKDVCSTTSTILWTLSIKTPDRYLEEIVREYRHNTTDEEATDSETDDETDFYNSDEDDSENDDKDDKDKVIFVT